VTGRACLAGLPQICSGNSTSHRVVLERLNSTAPAPALPTFPAAQAPATPKAPTPPRTTRRPGPGHLPTALKSTRRQPQAICPRPHGAEVHPPPNPTPSAHGSRRRSPPAAQPHAVFSPAPRRHGFTAASASRQPIRAHAKRSGRTPGSSAQPQNQLQRPLDRSPPHGLPIPSKQLSFRDEINA